MDLLVAIVTYHLAETKDNIVLRQAHARTFNLLEKMKKEAKRNQLFDSEIESLLSTTGIQEPLSI